MAPPSTTVAGSVPWPPSPPLHPGREAREPEVPCGPSSMPLGTLTSGGNRDPPATSLETPRPCFPELLLTDA